MGREPETGESLVEAREKSMEGWPTEPLENACNETGCSTICLWWEDRHYAPSVPGFVLHMGHTSKGAAVVAFDRVGSSHSPLAEVRLSLQPHERFQAESRLPIGANLYGYFLR